MTSESGTIIRNITSGKGSSSGTGNMPGSSIANEGMASNRHRHVNDAGHGNITVTMAAFLLAMAAKA